VFNDGLNSKFTGKSMITIGKIVKAQGIKGEVKVLSMTRDASYFNLLKSVNVDGINYPLKTIRVAGDFVYLLLDGVTDRNTAENFRDKEIRIEKDQAKPLDADEYYISDLIGLKVITTDGEEIGTLTEVISTGATDVFVVKGANRKSTLFPHLTRVVVEINVGGKRITVDKAELDRVVVY